MASKKRHIKSESELLTAMRSTGYCFPTNQLEQAMAVKFQEDIDFELLANEIDPAEIWNAKEPRAYSNKGKVISMKAEDVRKTWGIAAKGNADLSNDVLNKIRKNQEKKN